MRRSYFNGAFAGYWPKFGLEPCWRPTIASTTAAVIRPRRNDGRGVIALPWHRLSPDELGLLETAFWTGGAARHALAEALQFSRSKTNALAAGLIEQGLLDEVGVQHSTGGRRPETLRVHEGIGVLIGVDIGATSLDVALLRPDLAVIARHSEPADVQTGPVPIMARLRSLLLAMLAQHGIAREAVLAVGIGVPGPVNFAAGQLVNPPLMPGWDSYAIRDDMREITDAPVFVDNDVNLMALGVLWRQRRQIQNFLVIKVGTGIGCGIVGHGALYRGATGLGRRHRPHLRRCGGPALQLQATVAASRRWRPPRHRGNGARGRASPGAVPRSPNGSPRKGRLDASDVGAASRDGDAEADAIVRRSGRLIGEVLAALVNFYNPSHIFIGGGVAAIGPMFLAAIRQSVNQRSLALSTRHLEITSVPLGPDTGLIGAGVLAMREALSSGSPA